MKKYDFDQIIDRRGTNCLKYDFAVERGKDADVLPLWVADMDFQVADGIRERLHQSVEHGIFGYSESKEDYYQAVAGWYRENFSWEPKKSWLVKTPGVVFAIAMAVQAYTKPGDGVLIQQPVYYPFSEVIKDNGRNIVNSSLVLRDGQYKMDFEDFEKKIFEDKDTQKHLAWLKAFINKYPDVKNLSVDEILENILNVEIGLTFSGVLEDAGVFKRDEKGKNAFLKFINHIGGRF